MVDLAPEFESRDNIGSTSQYASTVGTSAISLPSVAGGRISEVYIANPASNDRSTVISFSFDGGTTFNTLSWNSCITWSPKGTVTQIQIKADASNRKYEVILNREAT